VASTIFTGTSRYSQDFGAVIERSVGIASLKLTQMQQVRQRSSDELTALRNLLTEVAKLRGTLSGLGGSVAANALQITSSNTSLLTARSEDGAAAATYRVNVVSLGSYSTAVGKTSGKPVTSDPAAADWVAAGTTKLTLRTVDHTTGTPVSSDVAIDLAGATSLQAVVNAVNAQAGSSVQAAIVNVGTTAAPNYTITLQSTKLGKLGLQLKQGNPPPSDTSGDLLNVNETDSADPSLGSRAEYKINGATVYSESRTVTLAPKVTADLLKADAAQEVVVDVRKSNSSAKSTLKSFASSYNSLIGELDKMAAENGALKGNSLVASIRHQLRNALSQSFAGELSSVAKIGLEFQSDGTLKLNDTVFDAETSGKFDALTTLIGSSTTGLTRALNDAVNTIASEQGTGFLEDTITAMQASLEAEDDRISAETGRVEQFTRDLQDRLAKADAMIAQLEQQAEYFNNMFEAMRINQKSLS
jgi:flagellar hook-associated protein 2